MLDIGSKISTYEKCGDRNSVFCIIVQKICRSKNKLDMFIKYIQNREFFNSVFVNVIFILTPEAAADGDGEGSETGRDDPGGQQYQKYGNVWDTVGSSVSDPHLSQFPNQALSTN
jgi:hypothetical protein